MALLGDDDLRRRHDLVRSTTPSRVAAVPADAELVAVEGVVRVHEDPVTPPLADATVHDPDSGSPGAADGDAAPERASPAAPDDDAAATASTSPGATTGPASESRTTGVSSSGVEDPRASDESGRRPGATRTATPTRLDELAAEQGDENRGPPVLARYVRRPREGREPAETQVEARPFVVEDETGRLLVDLRDPPRQAVLLSPGITERYLGDETGTRLVRTTGADSTRAVARARNELGTTPEWVHERATLRDGDRVYVLGRPETDTEGETAIVPGEGTAFVVSDLSRAALTEQLDRAAGGLDRRFWLFAVVGAIAVVVVFITVAVLVDGFVL